MDEPRYYAECVDLIRKLVLSGLIGLISPGTVFQSFCSVLFSLVFLVAHIKLWPYPSASSNLLKLFADAQLFLVTLVGMVLRIAPDDLAKDPFAMGFGLTQVSCPKLTVSKFSIVLSSQNNITLWFDSRHTGQVGQVTVYAYHVCINRVRSHCTATYSGVCCC